jgi:hypothetical protein
MEPCELCDNQRLLDYLEGRLSPADETAVQQHAERCAPCEAELLRLAGGEVAPELMAGIRNAILKNAPAARVTRMIRVPLRLRAWFQAATAAAALLLVYIGLGLLPGSRGLPTAHAMANQLDTGLEQVGALVYRIHTELRNASLQDFLAQPNTALCIYYSPSLQFSQEPSITWTVASGQRSLVIFRGPSAWPVDAGREVTAYFARNGLTAWTYQTNLQLLERYSIDPANTQQWSPPFVHGDKLSTEFVTGSTGAMLRKLADAYSLSEAEEVSVDGQELLRYRGVSASDKRGSVSVLIDPVRLLCVRLEFVLSDGQSQSIVLDKMLPQDEANTLFNAETCVPPGTEVDDRRTVSRDSDF